MRKKKGKTKCAKKDRTEERKERQKERKRKRKARKKSKLGNCFGFQIIFAQANKLFKLMN